MYSKLTNYLKKTWTDNGKQKVRMKTKFLNSHI